MQLSLFCRESRIDELCLVGVGAARESQDQSRTGMDFVQSALSFWRLWPSYIRFFSGKEFELFSMVFYWGQRRCRCKYWPLETMKMLGTPYDIAVWHSSSIESPYLSNIWVSLENCCYQRVGGSLNPPPVGNRRRLLSIVQSSQFEYITPLGLSMDRHIPVEFLIWSVSHRYEEWHDAMVHLSAERDQSLSKDQHSED